MSGRERGRWREKRKEGDGGRERGMDGRKEKKWGRRDEVCVVSITYFCSWDFHCPVDNTPSDTPLEKMNFSVFHWVSITNGFLLRGGTLCPLPFSTPEILFALN